MRRQTSLGLAALAMLVSAGPAKAADPVRIGLSRLSSCAPIAIADAKGYFKAEGLDAQFTYFDSQQPISVAVTSGDLDFGLSAETAALYSLAGGGKLRIVAGGTQEVPGFHYLGIVASNQAYAAGLHSAADFRGHRFALTQMGTGLQYALGQIAEKYRFDLKTVQIMPLQSNANIASALAGGRVDMALFDSTNALPLVQKNEVKLLGWVADVIGRDQTYLFFAATSFIARQPDTVTRVLAAFRKGVRDYHDAFTAPDGARKDMATAPEMLAILAKFENQPAERVAMGLPYYDRDARIDVADVKHQIEWYRQQGQIKAAVDADQILDQRYILPMPQEAAR